MQDLSFPRRRLALSYLAFVGIPLLGLLGILRAGQGLVPAGLALPAPVPAPSGSSLDVFALFVGAAMSVTPFPVRARILAERGLISPVIVRHDGPDGAGDDRDDAAADGAAARILRCGFPSETDLFRDTRSTTTTPHVPRARS